MIEPWERIAWSEEYQQVMYRDWGSAFTAREQLDIAHKYYTKSLELNPDDLKARYLRSRCNLQLARTETAFEDGEFAASKKPKDVDFDLNYCRAVYELNRFEDAKRAMHDKTRIYRGRKVKEFNNMIIVLNENFKDSVGASYGPFIMKAARYFDALFEEMERRRHVETRPLWKILRDAGKCDVMSIIEKEEELLHPREVARRERAFRVFNQMYMNSSWTDVGFLRDLRNEAAICWPPSKMSAPFLKGLVDGKYQTVKAFLRMLHARSPLYNELMVKFGSKKMMEKNRELQLNRVQYQTRRDMLTILRKIKKLRAAGQVDKLGKYIEMVMGDYVVLKTHRVMPWKFEFMNDVYNTLALAYADQYMNMPDLPDGMSDKNKLLLLLRLPTEHKEKPAFVFGDKSTYQEPDAIDYNLIAYKKFLSRLEKRLVFARYPIEICYLHYRVAKAHLKNQHYAECINAARKAIEVVNRFNNRLWALLSRILIIQANASLYKVENCYDELKEALDLVADIKSPELFEFISRCNEINNSEIAYRKRARSTELPRKRKSRYGSQHGSVTELSMTDSTETMHDSAEEGFEKEVYDFRQSVL